MTTRRQISKEIKAKTGLNVHILGRGTDTDPYWFVGADDESENLLANAETTTSPYSKLGSMSATEWAEHFQYVTGI